MAGLLQFIKTSLSQKETKSTASLAKERLQIIIAREHTNNQKSFLPQLEKELLDVIRKYVHINEKDIKISLNKQGDIEIIDLNIVIDADSTVDQKKAT